MYIDLTRPYCLCVLLFLTLCFIYLGLKQKKALITLIPLIAFLAILISHILQITIFTQYYKMVLSNISLSIIWDFIFILLSYISYLWADETETKSKNKKSINNCLHWFWKKV